MLGKNKRNIIKIGFEKILKLFKMSEPGFDQS
jgi:hypothetical protein